MIGDRTHTLLDPADGRGATHCRRSRAARWAGALALTLASGALVGTLAAQAGAANLDGTVKSGSKAIGRAPVTLLRTPAGGARPVAIAKDRTDRRGRFSFTYRGRHRSGLLYVVSGVPGTSKRRDVRLASLIGTAPPREVTLNERTTVAAGFTEAQFVSGWRVRGLAPGPENAAMMAHNLAAPVGGTIARALGRAPNGTTTPTLKTFNSLANMLAGCARTESRCARVFRLTRVPGERQTDSILRAVANVARNPAHNAAKLFGLSRSGPTPYSPALNKAGEPAHWALMLRFAGDGKSMNGPGNIAFDAEGNAWVANNYTYSRKRLQPQCGSDLVLKFRPDGSYAPGSPYSGGGLSGVGFGIAFDPDGKLWLSNFGFAAPGCADPPPHNSLSKFDLEGRRESGPSGITAGMLSWPQGLVANDRGDIWIANCGPFNAPASETLPHDSYTIYPGGDPSRAQSFRDPSLDKPFDITFNGSGQAFISSTASSLVGMYEADGAPTAASPISGGGIDQPMGVASDSRGNIWVANSAAIDLPCPGNTIDRSGTGGSVTLIGRDGRVRSPGATAANPGGGFGGGGATVPWGIAVDGSDNVWVANFAKRRVSQFCGVRQNHCPKGLETGDPISPDGGWSFSGLTRNTAVEIDPSGNVWITNNWKQVPLPPNPGSYEMVVMVGAAGPVKTPLIGLPQPLD